jgi:predicted nucleic acid-binding protein
MIAGIALARRAMLATHNVKHFDDADIEIVNPLG